VNKVTAAYIRVSTKDQKADSQLRELKRYCLQRGWKKVEFFVDKIGGAKASRPELDRMVTALRAGGLERVVAYKLDRLGRSITHLCLLVDEMTRLGIPLICSSQGIDTSEGNPCGKFQLDVLKAVCEFERNLIRDRVNIGLAAARARGVRLGRPTTLDKRADEVLALKTRGMGLRAISRELGMAVSSVHSVLATAKANRSRVLHPQTRRSQKLKAGV
jgi:DNA invertase Pin-like site-specific DNA recombinase